MIDWKIYYEDGYCLEGNSETIIPAERRIGIIVIAYKHEKWGRFLSHSQNWFILKDTWYAVDDFGLHDQLLNHFDEIKCVAAGRWTTHENFEKLLIRACDEPGLPFKSEGKV